jgi:hypothetical protein
VMGGDGVAWVFGCLGALVGSVFAQQCTSAG